jgi:hypothetical protein
MSHFDLVEIAKRAIENVACDVSVELTVTCDSLKEIRDELDVDIDAVEKEL